MEAESPEHACHIADKASLSPNEDCELAMLEVPPEEEDYKLLRRHVGKLMNEDEARALGSGKKLGELNTEELAMFEDNVKPYS